MANWKDKDEEEFTFADGLSSLGKALSAKQERESTLKSLGTITKAVALAMKVRERNQEISKEKIGVTTQKGSSFADINKYYNILTDKSNITKSFGENSDVTRNFFREAEALNPEDPMQSLLGKNFQVNMSNLSGVVENTQYEVFADQYQSKFADMVKQSGEQTAPPVTPNKPNVEGQNPTDSIVNQVVPNSAETEIKDTEKLKEDQKTTTEETDTKVEETELPEQDQTDNVVVEEPVTTDDPVEDTTDYFEDPDKKKLGSLFGGARG